MMEVTEGRWSEAQRTELKFATAMRGVGDDWNEWWADKFDGYGFMLTRHCPNVLEVGCGPNTNLRIALPKLKCQHIYLEDPLIQDYLSFSQHLQALLRDKNHKVSLTSAPVESLPFKNGMMGAVFCLNVLSHVRSVPKALLELQRVLSPGGYLILGEDLTNEADCQRCPEVLTDTGHPVRFDYDALRRELVHVIPVSERILAQHEGRNPKAHYGTLIGVYERRWDGGR